MGGSFDFLTGKIKRAPLFLQKIGLEWMWRLFQEPKRIKRISNAVFVFSFKFLHWRFIQPLLYRQNVSILLYKKEGNKYKILIVERAEQPNHWQLPQGGTEGENLKQAGARELKEELNLNNFKIIKTIPNLHKYKIPEAEQSPRSGKYGYKGQKQGLLIAEFIGKDEDIQVNYWDHSNWKWVDLEDLDKHVYYLRKEATRKFLQKFYQIMK